MIFQKTGFHFSGSCARPPVSRICVSILVCVCVCGQSCAGSNIPAARRLPPCARTPMAISSSVSRLFSWPSAFHRLSGRVLRAAFLLRDILACELARSRDPTGINQFRSLPHRSASGTRHGHWPVSCQATGRGESFERRQADAFQGILACKPERHTRVCSKLLDGPVPPLRRANRSGPRAVS